MFLAAFAGFVVNAQTVQRTVLLEEFTNASCPPCAAQNPAFNALVETNAAKVVTIKYQTDWPGYDPMNEQNPSQVQTRVDYYGVTGVPNVRIDGTTDAGTAGQVTQAKINTAYAVPSKLQMALTHSVSDDLTQITINCTITNVDTVFGWSATNAKLRVGVIEKNLYFPAPPGTNGETHFNYVMRKMYPDETGTTVDPIPANGSVNFSWTVDLPDYIYNYNEIGVVAFVQAEAAKTVYQAAISQPVVSFLDGGVAAATVGNAGLCDYDLTPSATIKNEGGVEITSFDVSYTVNGGTPVTQAWTGSLAPGASETVDFPGITMTGGGLEIGYDVTNINNGAIDVNLLNDLSASEFFSAIPADPIGHVLVQDLEADTEGETPSNAIGQRSSLLDLCVVSQPYIESLGGAPTDVLGGFGQSDKSILVDFYNMAAGTTSSMTFYKLDWESYINDTLSFDIAYRQFSSENDRLEILVSTDCGDNWTSVYDKAGAQLKTVSSSQAFFLPTGTQWRKDKIDLSAFDDAPEVIVRFEFTSDYGNNLFMDNINIGGTFLSGVEDAIVAGDVKVFPNPASSVVNIDFTMAQANNVTLEVYDVTGKLVTTLLDNQLVGAGAQNVQWKNPASTGMYFVKIRTEEGSITRKVSVVK